MPTDTSHTIQTKPYRISLRLPPCNIVSDISSHYRNCSNRMSEPTVSLDRNLIQRVYRVTSGYSIIYISQPTPAASAAARYFYCCNVLACPLQLSLRLLDMCVCKYDV